jgi:hypothetical protein
MAKVFGHGDTGQSTKVSESDITIKGTTPTLTVGDGGAEDTKIIFDGNAKDFYVGLDDTVDKLIIGVGQAVGTNNILTMTDDTLTIGDGAAVDITIVFDGNAQDYYIGIDDGTDDLMIGLGSTMGTTPALSIDENLNVKTYADITMTGTTPTLTIGDAGAEDTAIVFDGNAQDFYIGLDDTADNLVFGKGSALGTTQYAAFTAANTEGFMYKPHAILDTEAGGTTLTALQSGTTVVLSNSSGYVTLPEGGTTDYGMQFVIVNATTSNNTGAIRNASSSDIFYDSTDTNGYAADTNMAVAAMKAKTVIYFKENGWLVIG